MNRKQALIFHYSNGVTQDITDNSNVSWLSSDSKIAKSEGVGLYAGIAAGTAYVSANWGAFNSNAAALTVT
jgi:uncharacterized protein YjdB